MIAPRTAIFVRADDGRVLTRLRDVTRRGIDVTLFAGSQDPRAERLAAAVDAELGAIAPDAHLPVVLCPGGPPRGGIVGAIALVVPDAAGGWQTLYPDGTVRATVDGADPEALALAAASGDALGPVGRPPASPAVDLTGLRAIHVASVPRTIGDDRFPRTVAAVRAAGADVEVRTVAETRSRRERIGAGWRLVRAAHRERPDVLHIHDPELLPAAFGGRRRCPIVYEAHSDLRATARTRGWIPRPIRWPFAAVAGRLENILAARLAAVVTDSKLSAIDFAARGARAVGIADPVGESAKIVALYGRLTGRA